MLTFQQLILSLQHYWDQQGCILLQPYDMEVGAGTSHTATFLRAIGPEPWRAAYVQPSRRPKDGRYGDNPNRLQHYYQFQVVLKPSVDGGWEYSGVHHNKQGLRGADRTPQSLDGKSVIELFGGSNAYDVYSREDQAWANLVEKNLGADRYAVINHAVPGYSSAEHVIQTAFYQTPYGEKPRCAAYSMGWGELLNAHIKDLDPGYADYHMRWLVDALHARRLGRQWMLVSPVFSTLGLWLADAVDTARPVPASAPREPVLGSDPALEAIFTRNVWSISAINRDRGIKTVWISQPMNVAKDPPLWTDIQRLNAIMKREAGTLGDTWIEIPMDKFTSADFKNMIHFLPAGSKKFADLLAPPLGEACR